MTNKKISKIIITVAFVAVTILLITATFSLSKIDVEYRLYSDGAIALKTDVNEYLNGYLKRSMFVIKESKIKDKIEENKLLKVTYLDKVYPYSIKIVIEEKLEIGVIKQGDSYYTFDCDGTVLFEKTERTGAVGANKLVELITSDSVCVFTEGQKVLYSNERLFESALCVILELKGYENNVKSVVMEASKNEGRITVNFVEGCSIAMFDAMKLTKQKTDKLKELYNAFSVEEKLSSNKIIQVIGGQLIIDNEQRS